MNCVEQSSCHQLPLSRVAARGYGLLAGHKAMGSASVPHNQYEGKQMHISHGPYHRKVRGDRTKNRISTSDFSDWLRAQLREMSAKEIADMAGCGVRAAENVKQGRNNFMSAHFATLCANNPKIASAWAEYVGLILPGQAEFAGAFTQAVNAYVRRSVE